MKRFLIFWIVMMVLLSTALFAAAQEYASLEQPVTVSLFVSCIEKPSESGYPRVWFGYEASESISGTASYGPSDGAGFIGYPPNTLNTGRFDKVFAVELQTEGVVAFYQFIDDAGNEYNASADADTDAISCDELAARWHPGAPSIAVALTTDCAYVEIQDAYGHWSQVTSNGEAVLLHYGDALIGGPDQSTDPADYRAVPTACY